MGSWTPEAITALITAIVSLVGAIAGAIVALRTKQQVKENTGVLEVHAEKLSNLESGTKEAQ